MKKKLVIMTLLSGMILTSLVACKGDKEAQSTEQSSEVVRESETETELENETETTTEKVENSERAEQIVEPILDENATKLKRAEEIASMSKEEIVNEMMSWVAQLAGFESSEFEISKRQDIKTLDNRVAITTAMYNIESYNGIDDLVYIDEKYGFIVPDILLNQSMKDLFGIEFSVEEYITAGNFGSMIGEHKGRLLLGLGDWGCVYPVYILENIEESNGLNYVTGRVVWEDCLLETQELIAQVTATISENADSQYGYVIESLTVNYVD